MCIKYVFKKMVMGCLVFVSFINKTLATNEVINIQHNNI